MKVKHIERRERVGGKVRVTTQCGSGEPSDWQPQDARDLVKLVREGVKPRTYGKAWTFCDACLKEI